MTSFVKILDCRLYFIPFYIYLLGKIDFALKKKSPFQLNKQLYSHL